MQKGVSVMNDIDRGHCIFCRCFEKKKIMNILKALTQDKYGKSISKNSLEPKVLKNPQFF